MRGASLWLDLELLELERGIDVGAGQVERADPHLKPLEALVQRLAKNQELNAYRHLKFWQPMDTLRDKVYLEELWSSGDAPWKIW